MKPTQILSEEHKYILEVIAALNRECQSLESGKNLDKNFFEEAIDFIRNYADKFHHAKEEDILFKEGMIELFIILKLKKNSVNFLKACF